MKVSDILRRLANTIDGLSDTDAGRPDPSIQNPAQLNAVSPNGTTAAGNDKAPADQFLPPLQMKQELLKKAVSVENVYDDGSPTAQDDEDQQQAATAQVLDDIVNRIKQLSGIPTAAVQELGNDDVFDD